MAMGKSYSLLCPFFFVLLIHVLQASHHEWDEATLSALKASKSSSLAPREAYRTAYHFQPVKHWMNGIFEFLFFSIRILLQKF
jgi:hypothetical protein